MKYTHQLKDDDPFFVNAIQIKATTQASEVARLLPSDKCCEWINLADGSTVIDIEPGKLQADVGDWIVAVNDLNILQVYNDENFQRRYEPIVEGPGIESLFMKLAAWSDDTFGNPEKRGPAGPVRHLVEECYEILERPDDLTEYADALLLIMDASRRAGFAVDRLIHAAHQKLAINKEREWGEVVEDQPVHHKGFFDPNAENDPLENNPYLYENQEFKAYVCEVQFKGMNDFKPYIPDHFTAAWGGLTPVLMIKDDNSGKMLRVAPGDYIAVIGDRVYALPKDCLDTYFSKVHGDKP